MGKIEQGALCDECCMNPSLFHGSGQFAQFKYCEWCWASFLATVQEAVEIIEGVEANENGEGINVQSDIGYAECGKKDAHVIETNLAQNLQDDGTMCDECSSLPGVIQGLGQFANLKYCERCWAAYVATMHTLIEKIDPTCDRACKECRKSGADIPGSGKFTGEYYCCSCWQAYQASAKANSATCASCDGKPALLKGSGAFSGLQYCEACWCEAMDVNTKFDPTKLLPDVDAWSWRQHYDFIEVGTSNWGTISHFCAGCNTDVASRVGAEIQSPLVDLYFARGLAVEPVGAYLNSLPSLPNVKKLQCAMGEFCSKSLLYGVSSENIRRYQGRYEAALPGADPLGVKVDVMWYAVSLSSVGHPHPKLEQMLEEVAREDLLESWPVEVIDWGTLCKRHQVGSVDVVQIDCEGRDCSIVRSMLAYCEDHPRAYPRLIYFEANDLTEESEIQSTLDSLSAHGYCLRSWGENMLVERR